MIRLVIALSMLFLSSNTYTQVQFENGLHADCSVTESQLFSIHRTLLEILEAQQHQAYGVTLEHTEKRAKQINENYKSWSKGCTRDKK